MADDDTDDIDDTDYSMPDPFVTAIELCRIASSPKTIAAALKKLRKLGLAIDAAEAKLAAVQVQAAEIATKLETDVGALDERQRAFEARAVEFETSLHEAHATLRQHHARLSDTDRRIRWRVLNSADLLAGFNEQLQDLPDWPQIKQMVPGLPDDPPTAPPTEAVFQEVREDWTGHVFVPGSTLTRTINKVTSQ
jgi:hypothetical protein